MADSTPDIIDAITPKTPLDIPNTRNALKDTLPNHLIQQGYRVGGVVFTSTIWQFQIEVSLNASKVSFCDARGEGLVIFTFTPTKGRTIEIKKEAITSLEELKVQLEWVKSYLSGVASAILMAFEEAPKAPAASINNLS
jgi:hypothetical protein